jgi:hypothetical protein
MPGPNRGIAEVVDRRVSRRHPVDWISTPRRGKKAGELLYLQRALKRGQNRAHNKKPLCGVAAFLAPLQGASQQNNTPRVNPG